jgi:hypothetical protein
MSNRSKYQEVAEHEILFTKYGRIPEHKKLGAHIKWWKGFEILLVTIYFTL